jgi:NADPH:quinone reductase-like Zn-dependent oxidoreductase
MLVGVDYAGEVVQIGNNPKASLKVGDRVVGLVRGCKYLIFSTRNLPCY